MAKVTEIMRESRNNGCPAVHEVDGSLKLATGEVVPEGMVLLQAYMVDDPDAVAQIQLDPGEGILAATESYVLKAADAIRARRGL
jgi:hypothetical protein